MPDAACHNPAGGRMDDIIEVAHTLGAPRASGVFPDARPERLKVPKQWTDNDPAH